MADIHILRRESSGSYRLVCHFPVVDSNNGVPVAAGGPITWREAIVNYLSGSPASILPGGDGTKGTISAAETDEIASGAVVERAYLFPLDSGGTTDAQRVAALQAFYAAKKAEVAAELAAALGYFGAILNEE